MPEKLAEIAKKIKDGNADESQYKLVMEIFNEFLQTKENNE